MLFGHSVAAPTSMPAPLAIMANRMAMLVIWTSVAVIGLKLRVGLIDY